MSGCDGNFKYISKFFENYIFFYRYKGKQFGIFGIHILKFLVKTCALTKNCEIYGIYHKILEILKFPIT